MRPLIVAVADGMGDLPCPASGGTPLETAATPTLDQMARHAVTGLCRTIPPRTIAGTETGLPALAGYDPQQFRLPRGPLEAMGAGISPAPDTAVWRLNIVSLDPADRVDDFTAGNLDDESAARLLHAAAHLAHPSLACITGSSFRHLLLQHHARRNTAVPDIPLPHESQGAHRRILLDALQTVPTLHRLVTGSLALPQARRHNGGKLMLWPWGQGHRPHLPSFAALHGRRAAMVAGIPLALGLAQAAGMTVARNAAFTGDIHTDYAAKSREALALLKDHDTVFIHLEATDLYGHNRDAAGKRDALTRFDTQILRPLYRAYPQAVFLVTCDHLTPVTTGRHHAGPVPFLVYDAALPAMPPRHFCEATAARSGLCLPCGPSLLGLALEHACSPPV
jgi:2,3-bisphosphoglycerate-independent phosphoglycerate mutase